MYELVLVRRRNRQSRAQRTEEDGLGSNVRVPYVED
jgi:hypothetical protein